jgi:hypothetical protein
VARVLTVSTPLTCGHPPPVPSPSRVTTVGTSKLSVQGSLVLLKDGILNQPVLGCPTTVTNSTAPCATVDSITVGESVKLTVGGKAVMLDSIVGVTKPPTPPGAPPGVLAALPAGPNKLTAV